MGDPFGVGEVPAEGFAEAFGEAYGLFPAEFGFKLRAVDGVAAVVAGAVFDIGDKAAQGLGGFAGFFCDQIDELLEEFDVLPFVFAADVVFFAYPALLHDKPHGAVVVFHIEPVPDIFAIPIDRKGLSFQHVQHHEGDEFFRELIGAVVVGTIGKGYGEAVGMVVGHDEVVARCLAGRIGRSGVIGGGFGKVARVSEAPVNFVGGDVMKEDRGILCEMALMTGCVFASPGGTGDVQEGKGSHDVGADKGLGAQNGPVHVAFGRKVDHPINLIVRKKALDKGTVADIPLHEDIAGIGTGPVAGLDIGEAFGVARIGEEVQVDDPARKA